MDPLILLLFLISIIWTCSVVLKSNSRGRKTSKLPPGPYPFPIIGNILELGPKPHLSLAKLSKTYGPLMSLKLGTRTTIVISSPELAKIILQTNDALFSGRVVPSASKSELSIVMLPAQKEWRKLRKICKEKMFSSQRLDASYGIRKENLRNLHDYVKVCCEKGQVVDIGKAAFTTSLNLISASLFSMKFAEFNSDSSQEMKDTVWGLTKCAGTPNMADFFPILESFDPQGILKETEMYIEKLLTVFDGIINEKLNSMARGEKIPRSDFVEELLYLNQSDGSNLSINEIKHLLIDLFVAGTDTTTGTVEWAMAELLRNPDKISRARSEIRDLVGDNGEIQESDISKLPYLQAVVKETFRLHPTVPFLVPHKAEADVEINGYVVPKNAQILVNIWATGRDSSIWTNANIFIPERFLDECDIDFRGNDFELIPFGAGRRICPGLPLAHRMVHLMLATFVHKFGWKFEEQEIDMTEKFGLTLQKAIPLKAIPTDL